MKLHELVATANINEYMKVIDNTFKPEADDMICFVGVFHQLQKMKPLLHDEFTICLEAFFWDASIVIYAKNAPDLLDMRLLPWSKWLGANIDEVTLHKYNTETIVAFCLNEMTCLGWSDEEVAEEAIKIISELDNEMNEIVLFEIIDMKEFEDGIHLLNKDLLDDGEVEIYAGY